MGRGIEAAGLYSVAIALNDQTGAIVAQDNTMAIMGGNVGIGTTTPMKTLEISSVMLLTPTDTPGTCIEGSVYYDASLHEPCFCNGTNWKQFDNGGNC